MPVAFKELKGFNLIICQVYMKLSGINPLTTDDAIWCRLTLAACYQLAQSVLKIGFALAKKAG